MGRRPVSTLWRRDNLLLQQGIEPKFLGCTTLSIVIIPNTVCWFTESVCGIYLNIGFHISILNAMAYFSSNTKLQNQCILDTPYNAEYNNTIVDMFLERTREGLSKANNGKSTMYNDGR